jgi:hypothetical protein
VTVYTRPSRPLAPVWARLLIGVAVPSALAPALLPSDLYFGAAAGSLAACPFYFVVLFATALAADLDRPQPRAGLAVVAGASGVLPALPAHPVAALFLVALAAAAGRYLRARAGGEPAALSTAFLALALAGVALAIAAALWLALPGPGLATFGGIAGATAAAAQIVPPPWPAKVRSTPPA